MMRDFRNSMPVITPLLLPKSAGVAAVSTFLSLANFVVSILNRVTVMLILLAIVIFFYGAVVGLWKNTEKGHKDMYKFLGWGVGVIFVMVSIWGIIKLLQSTLLTGSLGGSSSSSETVGCDSFGSCSYGQ